TARAPCTFAPQIRRGTGATRRSPSCAMRHDVVQACKHSQCVRRSKPMTRPASGIILMVTLLFVLVSVAVAADTVAITARQAVVRAGPDSKQRILATVPQGTTLALVGTRKGWYKVLLDDGQE